MERWETSGWRKGGRKEWREDGDRAVRDEMGGSGRIRRGVSMRMQGKRRMKRS